MACTIHRYCYCLPRLMQLFVRKGGNGEDFEKMQRDAAANKATEENRLCIERHLETVNKKLGDTLLAPSFSEMAAARKLCRTKAKEKYERAGGSTESEDQKVDLQEAAQRLAAEKEKKCFDKEVEATTAAELGLNATAVVDFAAVEGDTRKLKAINVKCKAEGKLEWQKAGGHGKTYDAVRRERKRKTAGAETVVRRPSLVGRMQAVRRTAGVWGRCTGALVWVVPPSSSPPPSDHRRHCICCCPTVRRGYALLNVVLQAFSGLQKRAAYKAVLAISGEWISSSLVEARRCAP